MDDDLNERSVEVLDRYSIQIARVVIAAGFYEDDLAETLKGTLQLTTLQTNALVRPMGTRAKLDLLCRLAKVAHITPDKRRQIIKHSETAKRAFDERNSIVHAHYGHNEEGKVALRSYSGAEKLTGKPKRWSIQEISDLAGKIVLTTDRLKTLREDLTNAGPLPEAEDL